MIPPTVSNSDRVGLATLTGALVYNITTSKLNFYNGVSWQVVTSS